MMKRRILSYGGQPLTALTKGIPAFYYDIELKKMSKKRLISHILRLQKFIILHAYKMYKEKLPRLRKTKLKALPKRKTRHKKMTKAEKTKFLARLNKGRKKAGLKLIRAKR